MALVFNTGYVGRAPHAAGSIFFALKECLTAAGWTVRFSGTGTSGTWGAGDLFTLGDVKAIGGIGNANSWFIVQDPGGRMEFAFRASADTQININFCREDGFPAVGHSATNWASQSPITDQAVIVGSVVTGNPARGLFIDVAAETAPLGTVYPFWLRVYGELSGAGSYSSFFLEALRPDSLQAGDTDNYVIRMQGNSLGATVDQPWFTTYNPSNAFERHLAATVGFHSWGVPGFYPGVPGVMTQNDKQLLFPPVWIAFPTGQSNPMPQFKGVSAYMKYNPYVAENPNSGYFQVGSKAYVPFGELLMPGEPGKLPRKPVT